MKDLALQQSVIDRLSSMLPYLISQTVTSVFPDGDVGLEGGVAAFLLLGSDLESMRVVVVIGGVDPHFVLVAAPRHVMAGDVGFHDVALVEMNRVDEDVVLDLQDPLVGHGGYDRVVAAR
ncbi:hypothetical protein F3Y22_tig00110279pilonHSYRG00032 [Hibiscus syriacus]|uniref:Uncharacterized protein n=1 Tax=Hibiscus syriacus TaxID=106335 RepID=A0A6A3B912_HIBSY|nr:hypothetical protein F3Y22_tig00110279pilonHSYRG00032 [Hibiscus syriacus]